MKTVIVTSIALTVSLGGCAALPSGRDSIVRAAPSCQDVSIPIYFEADEAHLTPESHRVIAAQAAQAKRCQVDGVRVVGLADAAGDPAANLELSKQRAASVADAIIKAGLPSAEFDLTAVGQAGSMTADGRVQPVRRRADITLRLANRK